MFILKDWTVIRLSEINPYKAVDLMGQWRLSFNNDDTIIKAKMLLQKLYKNKWKRALLSLLTDGKKTNKK